MAVNQTTSFFGKPLATVNRDRVVSKKEKVYGFTYPFGSRTGKGFFNKDSGKTLIVNNIRQLLRTEKGERVMLLGYGAGLKKYLFEPLDDITFESIKSDILHAINTYEPRVDILKLRVFSELGSNIIENNSVIIKLTLKIKDTVDNSFDVEVKI